MLNRPLHDYMAECHENNRKWWYDADGKKLDRNRGELLMLTITELAEAVEGLRKDKNDDHLPNRKMVEVEMADAFIRLCDFGAGNKRFDPDYCTKLFKAAYDPNLLGAIDNVSEQILHIAGAVFRLYQTNIEYDYVHVIALIVRFCEKHGYDLEAAYDEKSAYNKTRKDHSLEERMKDGGKKF